MIPAAFVSIEALPVTPTASSTARPPGTGTVRLAGRGAAYVAPRDRLERDLVEIWRELLEVDEIGIDDNFFALGGHSLQATRLVARLRSAYGVQLAVSSLFERPTVAGVAERLRGLLAGEEREQAIVSRERSGPVQLSLAQRRLWVLEQLNPGGASYNVPLVLRLRGPLDRELLARCLSELVARHEPLRTSFTTVDGEAVQCVAAPARIPLAVSDLRTLGDPRTSAAAAGAGRAGSAAAI